MCLPAKLKTADTLSSPLHTAMRGPSGAMRLTVQSAAGQPAVGVVHAAVLIGLPCSHTRHKQAMEQARSPCCAYHSTRRSPATGTRALRGDPAALLAAMVSTLPGSVTKPGAACSPSAMSTTVARSDALAARAAACSGRAASGTTT